MKDYKTKLNAYPSPCQIKTAKTALKCQVLQAINDTNRIHYGERETIWSNKRTRIYLHFYELTKIKNLN